MDEETKASAARANPVRSYEVVINVRQGVPPEWRPHTLAEDAYSAEDAAFQASVRFRAWEHSLVSVRPAATYLK
jgi:hypothetical protein